MADVVVVGVDGSETALAAAKEAADLASKLGAELHLVMAIKRRGHQVVEGGGESWAVDGFSAAEQKLEGIADSFKGVSKSFALQAGREIRIMVESEKVSDDEAVWLSKDIARRIENELEYPGQIKVTVIRETRAVEYAK